MLVKGAMYLVSIVWRSWGEGGEGGPLNLNVPHQLAFLCIGHANLISTSILTFVIFPALK